MAAGLFYLALTIPLTHLVNYIDARLRERTPPGRGRSAGGLHAQEMSDGGELEPVSLTANDIHLSFGPNAVLRGVDIDVAAGSTVAVIGPSGSGKSTLLRTLNRLYEPDRGDILLDGRSVLSDDPGRAAPADRHGVPAISTCSRIAACSTT